jgi:hypothetical protein
MFADHIEELSMDSGRPTDHITALQVFRTPGHIGDRAAGFLDEQ